MRRTSAFANIQKASRRKTEEEVVQGQGYANSILFHLLRASHTTMNDHRNAHTHPSNERNEHTRNGLEQALI